MATFEKRLLDARRQEKIRKAAPALLEALETMTALVRISYGNVDPEIYAQIVKAEAAIAAARGE